MISIQEYLLTSKIKKQLNKATDENIHRLVKEALDKQGSNADLNYIDVSDVTDMSYLFSLRTLNSKCLGIYYKDLNPDVSQWDVSNVTNMEYMFYYCEKFNCDISGWNVSNVENMSHMFYRCKKFYCDLHDWNAENVKSYSYMFSDRMVKKKKYWPKAFPLE